MNILNEISQEFKHLQVYVNRSLTGIEPWKIMISTILFTCLLIFITKCFRKWIETLINISIPFLFIYKMEILHYILQMLKIIQKFTNSCLDGMEPWKIVVYAFLYTHMIYNIAKWISKISEDGVYHVWHFIRSLPFIKESVASKIKITASEIERRLLRGLENKRFIKVMPKVGINSEKIIDEIKNNLKLVPYKWNEGYVSGAIYHGNNEELFSLMKEVYGLTAYTNPLHPDVFPGIRVMEAEIIHMISSLFHSPNPVGTVTTGGTESIFLVCKAYRDFARYVKRITVPNMVIPLTAHAAFDKAAQLLKIRVKHVKCDPSTMKVDVNAMKKTIDENTCMLVGSAPSFPHGSMDSIQEIGELGFKYGIPVHVDACLGGFLIPFMNKAGYPIPEFDFRVPGVTSISVDTHKYAYAPKGSSIILYKEMKYRHYQYSVFSDWPGGIYGTPNLSGSRSGGVIATCWASLLYHGEETYIESTRKIISVTKYIEKELRKIKEIFIIGQPDVSVIAIGSKIFDIFRLSSSLSEKGWNLNILQFPSGFHICVTLQHTYQGVADKFISDVKECLIEIMKDPGKPTSGSAAIYGMAQKIPDRSLVNELTWAYLDGCYSINDSTKETSK